MSLRVISLLYRYHRGLLMWFVPFAQPTQKKNHGYKRLVPDDSVSLASSGRSIKFLMELLGENNGVKVFRCMSTV